MLPRLGGCRSSFVVSSWRKTCLRKQLAMYRERRMKVLRTPYRVPQANAYSERLLGSMSRECLDILIPLREGHLRRVVKAWATYYNRSRPHMSLGPGILHPPEPLPVGFWTRIAYYRKGSVTYGQRNAHQSRDRRQCGEVEWHT